MKTIDLRTPGLSSHRRRPRPRVPDLVFNGALYASEPVIAPTDEWAHPLFPNPVVEESPVIREESSADGGVAMPSVTHLPTLRLSQCFLNIFT